LFDKVELQETGHDLLAKIKAEKAQLIAEKKLKKEKELPSITKDEIPFEIPGHWAWCRLFDLCEFINGKAHEKFVSENGNYILVTSRFVSTSGKTIKKTSALLTPLYINNIAIVMSDVPNGRALARSFLIDKDGIYTLNQRIGGIIPLEAINSKFLNIILNRNSFYLKFDDGKKQTNLRKDQILSCPIPLPPLHEQEQIVAKLEELLAFCDGLEESIKESQGYNEKLLQQVLREALQG
jgi:type I restriction enzyme S subunit